MSHQEIELKTIPSLNSRPSAQTLASARSMIPPLPAGNPPLPSIPRAIEPYISAPYRNDFSSIKRKPSDLPSAWDADLPSTWEPDSDDQDSMRPQHNNQSVQTLSVPPLGHPNLVQLTREGPAYIPVSEKTIYEVDMGRDRFPKIDFSIERRRQYTGLYQAVEPPHWTSSDMVKLWRQVPILIRSADIIFIQEQAFFGVLYRAHLVDYARIPLDGPIEQGSYIIIERASISIRYMVTWRRAINEYTSLVQVDAFLDNGYAIQFFNPDWPSFLLLITNAYCKVPFHPSLKQYYAKIYKSVYPTPTEAKIKELVEGLRRVFPTPVLQLIFPLPKAPIDF